jgi:hypothetical protein
MVVDSFCRGLVTSEERANGNQAKKAVTALCAEFSD